MLTIKSTVYIEKSLWIALFERTDKVGYQVARKIFGKEPTDPELYEFVLNHFDELRFGDPVEFKLEIKRMNPKRLQREVRKEMEKVKKENKPSTHAQDYMRELLESNKLERKSLSKQEKERQKQEQFSLKSKKRKEKNKGR